MATKVFRVTDKEQKLLELLREFHVPGVFDSVDHTCILLMHGIKENVALQYKAIEKAQDKTFERYSKASIDSMEKLYYELEKLGGF